MPELIDRNKLRETICTACPERLQCTDLGNVCFEIACINNAPTIEAEPVRKPEMSEADRKKCEEWCKDCEHIEMCKWYPFGGCDFRLLPKPEQPTIEADIDRAAILRLCSDIADEVTDIAFNSTHYHIRDCCEAIRKYLEEIRKELTEDAGTD